MGQAVGGIVSSLVGGGGGGGASPVMEIISKIASALTGK